MLLPPIVRPRSARALRETRTELDDTRRARVARGARTTVTASAVVALALSASGCAMFPGGSAAGDFEDWMEGVANVASVSASGRTDMPFLGTADGTVTLEMHLTPAEVADVVAHALAFESWPTVGITIAYPAPGFSATYDLASDVPADNARLDELVRALDAGTNATTVEVDTQKYQLEIAAEGPGDFLIGFDQVRAVAADCGLAEVAAAGYVSTDGPFSVSAEGGGDAAAARRVFTTLDASYPVLDADLDEDSAEVRLDVPRAVEIDVLARTTAPDLEVAVQYENVTRTGDGDFTAAELITATARAAAPVVDVQERARSVTIRVPALADALSVDAALSLLADSDVETTLVTQDRRFTLTDQSRPYAPYGPVLEVLAGFGGSIEDTRVVAGHVVVMTSSTVDLTALGAALARAPRECSRVVVMIDDGPHLELTPASTISAASFTVTVGASDESEVIAALVDGWNSAA